MGNRNWRLPSGVDELLPGPARSLDRVRRRVLDVFAAWGFEYVEPPLIEFLDALLVGVDDEMDLQTLKAIDQRSGRMLGIRSDMTAQAVRIDAHSLPVEGVQRLCYAGSVVLANPVSPLETRVPVKAGAELFGAPGLAADAEVIALMLEVLASAGVDEPILVLGHMGIYRSLIADLGLDRHTERTLFGAVQSKAESDIAGLVQDPAAARLLGALPGLMGEDVLDVARRQLAEAPADALRGLDALDELATLIRERVPAVRLRFDLAELVGYGYHNGPVFSAYHADHGRALARGGRYDGIGASFGRARPATGFDVSLKELISTEPSGPAIWVPWAAADDGASGLHAYIKRLRADGETVIVAVTELEAPPARCDRRLELGAGRWTIVPLGGRTP